MNGEFQRFNDLTVMASLRDSAIARGSQSDCSRGQGRSEAGNKSKIGRNFLYFCIIETALHDSP